MAGYAKSVIFPASSTLPELVVTLGGGSNPIRAYKLYVLLAAAALPWLLAIAARLWGGNLSAVTLSVALFLLYLWTDFPINYAEFGMIPYLLAVPLGLVTMALVTRYLRHGGFVRWLWAALASALVVLVHLTAAMFIAPAALLAYLIAVVLARRAEVRFSILRHLGVWLIPVVVLAVNAFWWLPGLYLASTKGESGFAFSHSSEEVGARLLKILGTEPPVQTLLWAVGLPGLVVLLRRDRLAGAGLAGLMAAGFFWGYLAGAFPALDFLQPGRHTYVFYSGAAVAGGLALAEILARLRPGQVRLDRWAVLAVLLLGMRFFGPFLEASLRARVSGPRPFLSSRPTLRLRWVVDQVREHVGRGERLLYEEGGFDLPGEPDPFDGGRYSGLLPHLTGVEVLGGPYLHAALTTNFTQFGEGMLFGQNDWNRDHFERYARLYRPAAILCWSRRARAFCRSNPDLVEIVGESADGQVLIGRIQGFGGDTISGKANVRAEPGKLHVQVEANDLDGRVILRYHSVPYLRSRPPCRLEAVPLEGDPVPFIGLRSPPGSLTLELDVLP